MRVVEVTEFGGPEVLVAAEAPDPAAGRDQVVVDVAVVGVLFVETQIRRGQGGEFFPVTPPYVPGFGVAGEVLSVGDGVDPGWVGRRVVAETDGGGYADRAVASVAGLIPVPEELDLGEAMALLHDGSTALALIESVDVRPGDWVLVQPAGGGLGSVLVQLAQAAGARVVGAARGEPKLDLARKLGAAAVVDYSAADWVDRVGEVTGGAGPNIVFDGIGGAVGQAAFEITARGGRFVGYGAASGESAVIDPDQAQSRGVTVGGLEQLAGFAEGRKGRAERLFHEAAAGRIKPVIGQTYPLERAADAHAAIEARRFVGKTLLLP